MSLEVYNVYCETYNGVCYKVNVEANDEEDAKEIAMDFYREKKIFISLFTVNVNTSPSDSALSEAVLPIYERDFEELQREYYKGDSPNGALKLELDRIDDCIRTCKREIENCKPIRRKDA